MVCVEAELHKRQVQMDERPPHVTPAFTKPGLGDEEEEEDDDDGVRVRGDDVQQLLVLILSLTWVHEQMRV